MNLVAMGNTGLTGWQRRAAHPVARAVATRSPLSEEQVLASIGGVLLVLSAVGFVRTMRTMIRAGRAGVD
jgi:hypothetical protein